MKKNELVPGKIYRVGRATMRYMYNVRIGNHKIMIFWPISQSKYSVFSKEDEEKNSLLKAGAFPLYVNDAFKMNFQEVETFESKFCLN